MVNGTLALERLKCTVKNGKMLVLESRSTLNSVIILDKLENIRSRFQIVPELL